MQAALLRLLGGERQERGFGEQQVSVDGNRVTVFNGTAPATGWRGGTGGRVEGSLLLILAPSLLPDAPARHPLAEPFPNPFPSICSRVTTSSAMPRGRNLEQGARSVPPVYEGIVR